MKITTNIRKLVSSLKTARSRREEQLFVAEGTRCVLDTLPYFTPQYIIATAQWLEQYSRELPAGIPEPLTAKPDEMERMSSLSTPQGVMAVYKMPEHKADTTIRPGQLVLALDRVQDPGNLGAIMRVADWFGIERIIASTDTVDVYNPKVVQSTMGAIARVEVVYADLERLLGELPDETPIYGTHLDGQSIYETPLTSWGVIVMGNEGNGISPEVEARVGRRLRIPSYPEGRPTVESLNVGMATAITVAEFRRRATTR